MRNILSGKTLTQCVMERGLNGVQEFPVRCTGDTTGEALSLIGDVMRKHKRSNCAPVRVWVTGRELVEEVRLLIERLDLKGFRLESDYRGGVLHYCVFEGK